jgi:hypothetical protein
MGKVNTPAHPAVQQSLEEADQMACSSGRGGGLGGQWSGAVPAQGTVSAAAQPGLTSKTLGETAKREGDVRNAREQDKSRTRAG